MVRLGLSLGDLYSLRPTDLAAMAHAYRRKQEEEQWGRASLMACIVNSGFSAPKGGVKPSDFMPKESPSTIGKPKNMTGKRRAEVADGIRHLMAQFMKGSKGSELKGDAGNAPA